MGPEILIYFWRLKNRIVGPLSESEISGSGFFIGLKKDPGPNFWKGSPLTCWADLLASVRIYNQIRR